MLTFQILSYDVRHRLPVSAPPEADKFSGLREKLKSGELPVGGSVREELLATPEGDIKT